MNDLLFIFKKIMMIGSLARVFFILIFFSILAFNVGFLLKKNFINFSLQYLMILNRFLYFFIM